MINWRENRAVGVIAGIILAIVIILIIANMVRNKAEEQKILQKKNPPAFIN